MRVFIDIPTPLSMTNTHSTRTVMILLTRLAPGYKQVMSFEKSCTNSTFRVHFNTQCLPSGSPSAHTARTKALVITTFASCILVLPAPVLWNSLIWDNCKFIVLGQLRWLSEHQFIASWKQHCVMYKFELFVNIHSCIYSACTVYGVLSMCQLVTS